jgi:hypothetical protein
LLAALSTAAISEPINAGISTSSYQGSAGWAPIAVTAPDKNPRAGAISVNGRASWRYSFM